MCNILLLHNNHCHLLAIIGRIFRLDHCVGIILSSDSFLKQFSWGLSGVDKEKFFCGFSMCNERNIVSKKRGREFCLGRLTRAVRPAGGCGTTKTSHTITQAKLLVGTLSKSYTILYCNITFTLLRTASN